MGNVYGVVIDFGKRGSKSYITGPKNDVKVNINSTHNNPSSGYKRYTYTLNTNVKYQYILAYNDKRQVGIDYDDMIKFYIFFDNKERITPLILCIEYKNGSYNYYQYRRYNTWMKIIELNLKPDLCNDKIKEYLDILTGKSIIIDLIKLHNVYINYIVIESIISIVDKFENKYDTFKIKILMMV